MLIFAVLALAVSGCGDDSEESGGTESEVPTVLSTIGIWSDIVSNVACGGIANVETLIPVGGDPHGFEASLQDRERMENAALVIANGRGLEAHLTDVLEVVADAGTPVFETAAHVDLIAIDTEVDGHDHEDDHGHEAGEEDAHVWFDPRRVSHILPELASHLIDDVGLEEDAVNSCLSDYQAELAALDTEIEELLERVPASKRKLVTNHHALGYFGDRYHFQIIGNVIPTAVAIAETNPAQLEALAEAIEHEGIKAIFSETLHSTDDVESLAARVGNIEVVTLYTGSLGPPGSGAEDYLGFMRTNANLIATALG